MRKQYILKVLSEYQNVLLNSEIFYEIHVSANNINASSELFKIVN